VRLFPNLGGGDFRVTSPRDVAYNCIAWAAGDTRRFWWPQPVHPSRFWPSGIPRSVTVDAFVAAFSTIGYAVCKNGELEAGCEKIALYVDETQKPKHMARQNRDGSWSSKLGGLEDITHATLNGLEGEGYGSVTLFMKRQIARSRQSLPKTEA
jgi:hypothetical protein